MSDDHGRSRRTYVKMAGGAGLVGLTGLSGCIGDLTGGGGPIPMGSILPITGQLSDFGSGMQSAVELAEEHINDDGGPLGRALDVTYHDSETRAEIGQQHYNTLVDEEDIAGFVGAASSAVTTPIAETVADDQVMQVSNASTSPALADIGYNDDESVKYFARTAPNDAQQGQVMGMILNQDEFVGADTVAFLHVDNPYGEGLAGRAQDAFEGEVTNTVPYAEETNDYTSTLDSLFDGDPDAIGFVGYPANGRTILQQWDDGGYGGEWVLSEGLNSADFFTELSDIISGMYVASPDPEGTDGAQTFAEAMGDTAGTLFAPHAYDGMMLMALAMHKAGEATGTAMAENIGSVSRPNDGDEVVTVDEFQRAKDLIDDGTAINYQGASSPVDMNASLEPLNRFAVLQIGDDGSTETLRQIDRSEF